MKVINVLQFFKEILFFHYIFENCHNLILLNYFNKYIFN